MSDLKKEIQKMFSIRERYSNFGAMIAKIRIQGFRGIEDLIINIESPVTAISGLNGTGKSTIVQLATCAYKKPQTEDKMYKRHHIANYFPVSKADQKPFKDDATIDYEYLTNTESKLQELKVSRAGSQWNGYKRQPERHCRYIGFTIYIPKVEQRDISVYKASQIEISEEHELNDMAKMAISKILSQPYDHLSSATASHNEKKIDIGFASKFGSKYSENHMGFGEGRVFYTVKSLESAPEQSLFVIEEPETSLHEYAQYEFAKYFIDVSIRRKHQIILTTHSRSILKALPQNSRKLLYRDGNNVKISDRTSTAEAAGILSLGQTHDKMILVEDDKAGTLLTELIRQAKPELLPGVKITYVGNDDIVAHLTKKFKSDGYDVIGIRDGDKGESRKDFLFKLPGSHPPETEVLHHPHVLTHLKNRYNFDCASWISLNPEIDFHDWPAEIACHIHKSEDGIWEELCAIYANHCSITELDTLIRNIES